MCLNISILLSRIILLPMNKLIPIFIDGKKWVQLSQLTADQARSLKSFLPVNCLKKILFQGIELSDCLDFDTYEFWYRSRQVSDQKQSLFDF
jgi:hypothetical protein